MAGMDRPMPQGFVGRSATVFIFTIRVGPGPSFSYNFCEKEAGHVGDAVCNGETTELVDHRREKPRAGERVNVR